MDRTSDLRAADQPRPGDIRDSGVDPYEGEHFLAYRELPDGRLLALVPLTFSRASVTLGPGGAEYDGGFSESWEYDDSGEAVFQFLTWNPVETAEPVGWVRHTPSMRRRGEALAEGEQSDD